MLCMCTRKSGFDKKVIGRNSKHDPAFQLSSSLITLVDKQQIFSISAAARPLTVAAGLIADWTG